MNLWRTAFLLAGLIELPSQASGNEARWYNCSAWGSSHTGHYTFRIGLNPCSVYWREIDTMLTIVECAPPRIVATKPFSVSNGYVLEFDLKTGSFEDFTPVWSDRGRCVLKADGATRR